MHYDYVVVNADRTQAVAEVAAIIDAEGRRTARLDDIAGHVNTLAAEVAQLAARLPQS